MANVNIDGKDYDLDSLSDNAKANINTLRITQSEIARLQAQIAIHKTAETAYQNAIKKEIES